MAACKVCAKARTQKYREENREAVLAKKRAYAKSPAGRAAHKRTTDKNRQQIYERERQRYAENPERYKEYRQRWYAKNWQRYYRENRERVKLWGHEHRRRLQVQGRGITPEEWMEKLASYEGLCHWCEEPHGEIPHMEHVMPVALGGLHEIENVVPACQRCNFRKGIKHPDDWRVQLKQEKRGE